MPPAVDGSIEATSLFVQFDWQFMGRIRLVSGAPSELELPDVRRPGVYRLTSGTHGGTIQDDAWYVGQSMTSIDVRVKRHLIEEFDAQTNRGKKFLMRLSSPDGWCQLEEASNIRLNGRRDLVGVVDGRFDADTIRRQSASDRIATQFLMNLVEASGQVTSTSFTNPQGSR